MCLCRYGLKSDTASTEHAPFSLDASGTAGHEGALFQITAAQPTGSSPSPEELPGRVVVPPDGGQVICSVSCCADTQEERGSSSVVLFVLIRIRH